jgi:hypothetical protein
VGDRITQIDARCAIQDGRGGQNDPGGPSPAAGEPSQAVLDAVRQDPFSDSQLGRLVMLALGKKTCHETRASEVIVACITTVKETGSGSAAQAPGAASEFDRGRQPKRRLDTEGEVESCLSGSAGAGDPPPASDDAQDAPPERREAAMQVSPAAPVAPPGSIAA